MSAKKVGKDVSEAIFAEPNNTHRFADVEPIGDGIGKYLRGAARRHCQRAEAYGWPTDLSAKELLVRIVALNKERAEEEARGEVRWLRPGYQIPRFGTATEKAQQFEADLGAEIIAMPKVAKPTFPTGDAEQTALIIDALIDSGGFASSAEIAARFKQGQRIKPAIDAVLMSLYRMALVSTSGGQRYAWRRAA